MNTTSKLLTACATTALGLLPAVSWAVPNHIALQFAGAAGIGQAEPTNEVEDLLRRARQLMDEGNFETAESYISRAEKLGPNPGLFQIGDTPKKARQDLDRKRSEIRGTTKPAGFPLNLAQPKTSPQDPFLRHGSASPSNATAGMPARLPAVESAQPSASRSGPSPSGTNPAASSINFPSDVQIGSAQPTANRTRSDSLLLEARRAMASGDIERAATAIQQAKSLQANYGLFDDSPAKVEATMNKFTALTSAGAAQRESETYRRQYSDLLLEQSQALLNWKQYDDAERLATDAKNLRVPYGNFEGRPETLLERIATERHSASRPATAAAQSQGAAPWANTSPARAQYDVVPAGGISVPTGARATPGAPSQFPGAQMVYDPAGDQTRNVMAADEQDALVFPGRRSSPQETSGGETPGARLFQQGQQALKDGNADLALQHFRDAYKFQGDLDPLTRHRLQEHLQLLSAPASQTAPEGGSLIDGVAAQQQAIARQMSVEVNRQIAAARAATEKEPQQALETLQTARASVESNAQLEPAYRDQLLGRLDLSIKEVNGYMQQNLERIELDTRNKSVREDIDRRRQVRVEVDEKLAMLVNDYNKLMEEQRFAEAEVVAKQAAELDPENPVVVQLQTQSRIMRRVMENMEIASDKEAGAYEAWADMDRSSAPFTGPIEFPDVRDWNDLTKRRSQLQAEGKLRRSPREMEIERQLTTPVSLKFNQRPLGEVLNYLAKMTSINLFIDPQGLAEEGVTSDTPVSIDLSQDISMKSALSLILGPLRLSYIVENDVLKITSEQARHGKLYTMTYNVADLIIPIPNFVANGQMGLEGALSTAYNRLGYNSAGGNFAGSAPVTVLADAQGGTGASAALNPALLAQMNAAGVPMIGGGGPPVTGQPQQIPFGPAGLSGGTQADFDSLIELITTTIQPQSWDDVGGPGSVAPFETNLSLVVSQTQEVHEEIVDLLQQLRRLQDLQVTIEVRFITLRDDFFERIGVDFDFNIDDNAAPDDPINGIDPSLNDDNGPSVSIGIQPGGSGTNVGLPTADLDLQFRQNSSQGAQPPFGGFTGLGDATTFGFAILSDIEAFFLIEAAQGDTRSNILQAPKVTLFNGQTALVADQSSRPFVTSVIPVVGDFAAAQQPVIVVLSEGTSLNVQAVVSNDRRFVRMTVVPFFSQIGDVEQFTFEGSKTTRKGSSSDTDEDDDTTSKTDETEEITTGTTVQQPTFSFVTVSTTVSVPDGGTVLLGGIKRLQEGRNERGLPILSKLPYINRLFRNVGIGRTTSSLMMMVTPRIIIQEEEEARLGIAAPVP